LGAVEAGLFPGVMLYLTYWFPKQYRARYVGMFAIGIPMASVIGSPISGLILNLDGVFGFKGWQWLYVLEAIPGVIIGVLIWLCLTDQPRDARWLTLEQRTWLQQTIDKERESHPEKAPRRNLFQSLRLLADTRVIALSIVFFGTGMPSYALSFWTPQMVHDFGFGNVLTGLVSAIPFACGSIAMILWARHSDRARERKWHTAIAAFVAAAGMMACFFVTSPLVTMIALSFAALGVFGLKGPFLSAVSESFSKETAAVGIAMIVSIGNLAGSASPSLIGFVKEHLGTYPPGLVAVGLCSLIGGLVMLGRPGTERSNV
jgi:MFS family permease